MDNPTVTILDARRLSDFDDSLELFGRTDDLQPYRIASLPPRDSNSAWLAKLPNRLPPWINLPCLYDTTDGSFSALDIAELQCDLAIRMPFGRYALFLFAYGANALSLVNHARVVEHKSEVLRNIRSGVLFTSCDALIEHVRVMRRQTHARQFRMQLPCVCNPDRFILHANINIDDSGHPIVYSPPFHFLPDEHAGCYNPDVLASKAAQLASHRIAWIQRMKILEFACSLRQITGMSFSAALTPTASKLSDAMIESVFVKSDGRFELPVRKPHPEKSTFEGGLVLDLPRGQFSGDIVVFDASSMYPSMVVEFNLDALLSELFRFLIAERQHHGKLTMNGRAIKVITNGVFGSRMHGEFADPQLAAEITRRGREVLSEAVRRTEAIGGFTVLAGDTDSLIVLCTRAPDILLEELNRSWSFVRFKIDARFMSLYMLTRKSYFAIQRTGEYYVRGLESVQSGVLPIIKSIHREWQRQVAGHLLTNKSDADDWVTQQAARLIENPPDGLLALCSTPKPTRQHPETDRAQFYREDKTFVPRYEMMRFGSVHSSADLQYWIKLQLVEPLLRYNDALF